MAFLPVLGCVLVSLWLAVQLTHYLSHPIIGKFWVNVIFTMTMFGIFCTVLFTVCDLLNSESLVGAALYQHTFAATFTGLALWSTTVGPWSAFFLDSSNLDEDEADRAGTLKSAAFAVAMTVLVLLGSILFALFLTWIGTGRTPPTSSNGIHQQFRQNGNLSTQFVVELTPGYPTSYAALDKTRTVEFIDPFADRSDLRNQKREERDSSRNLKREERDASRNFKREERDLSRKLNHLKRYAESDVHRANTATGTDTTGESKSSKQGEPLQDHRSNSLKFSNSGPDHINMSQVSDEIKHEVGEFLSAEEEFLIWVHEEWEFHRTQTHPTQRFILMLTTLIAFLGYIVLICFASFGWAHQIKTNYKSGARACFCWKRSPEVSTFIEHFDASNATESEEETLSVHSNNRRTLQKYRNLESSLRSEMETSRNGRHKQNYRKLLHHLSLQYSNMTLEEEDTVAIFDRFAESETPTTKPQNVRNASHSDSIQRFWAYMCCLPRDLKEKEGQDTGRSTCSFFLQPIGGLGKWIRNGLCRLIYAAMCFMILVVLWLALLFHGVYQIRSSPCGWKCGLLWSPVFHHPVENNNSAIVKGSAGSFLLLDQIFMGSPDSVGIFFLVSVVYVLLASTYIGLQRGGHFPRFVRSWFGFGRKTWLSKHSTWPGNLLALGFILSLTCFAVWMLLYILAPQFITFGRQTNPLADSNHVSSAVTELSYWCSTATPRSRSGVTSTKYSRRSSPPLGPTSGSRRQVLWRRQTAQVPAEPFWRGGGSSIGALLSEARTNNKPFDAQEDRMNGDDNGNDDSSIGFIQKHMMMPGLEVSEEEKEITEPAIPRPVVGHPAAQSNKLVSHPALENPLWRGDGTGRLGGGSGGEHLLYPKSVRSAAHDSSSEPPRQHVASAPVDDLDPRHRRRAVLPPSPVRSKSQPDVETTAKVSNPQQQRQHSHFGGAAAATTAASPGGIHNLHMPQVENRHPAWQTQLGGGAAGASALRGHSAEAAFTSSSSSSESAVCKETLLSTWLRRLRFGGGYGTASYSATGFALGNLLLWISLTAELGKLALYFCSVRGAKNTSRGGPSGSGATSPERFQDLERAQDSETDLNADKVLGEEEEEEEEEEGTEEEESQEREREKERGGMREPHQPDPHQQGRRSARHERHRRRRKRGQEVPPRLDSSVAPLSSAGASATVSSSSSSRRVRFRFPGSDALAGGGDLHQHRLVPSSSSSTTLSAAVPASEGTSWACKTSASGPLTDDRRDERHRSKKAKQKKAKRKSSGKEDTETNMSKSLDYGGSRRAEWGLDDVDFSL